MTRSEASTPRGPGPAVRGAAGDSGRLAGCDSEGDAAGGWDAVRPLVSSSLWACVLVGFWIMESRQILQDIGASGKLNQKSVS